MNEIYFSDIDLSDRCDSEFFQKKFLNNEKSLDHCFTKPLHELAKIVTSAFYPAATHLYDKGDIPFIRCVDCINFPIITHHQDDSFKKVPHEFTYNENGIQLISNNDIIITKVGTPCYSSMIYGFDDVALSRTVMGLTKIHSIDNKYLLMFLQCKYGFDQLYRAREQTIQFQLTVERVNNINIYLPSSQFQELISKKVNDYINLIFNSNTYYNTALDILFKHFQLPTLSTNNISIKNYSKSFAITERLDSEYYLEKYDDLFSVLTTNDNCFLNDIAFISKSIEPGSDYYGSEGIPFIRVGDVSKFGIFPTNINIPASLTNLRPKKNTILLSKDGSIGIAYKCESDLNIITSSALLHLNIKSKNILPDYLTLVLNSPIVKLQAERAAGGTIINHWKLKDVSNVIIPLLNLDIQSDISKNVSHSFYLRSIANKLLNITKSAIELAIEKGENYATQWLIKESNIIHTDN